MTLKGHRIKASQSVTSLRRNRRSADTCATRETSSRALLLSAPISCGESDKCSLLTTSVSKRCKRCKVRPSLLVMTNKKSHTRFRLVQKSTILDDFERLKRTLFQNALSFEAHHEYLNELLWADTRHSLSLRDGCQPVLHLYSSLQTLFIKVSVSACLKLSSRPTSVLRNMLPTLASLTSTIFDNFHIFSVQCVRSLHAFL